MKKKRLRDPASSQMLNCFQAKELLEYLTEKLPPARRSKIFDHLNTDKCSHCRGLYQSLKASFQLVDETSVAPEYAGLILEKLNQKPPEPRAEKIPLRLEAGQIWTTSPRPKNSNLIQIASVPFGIPVLIIWPNSSEKNYTNIIRVIPVSCDTEYQWHGETVLLDTTSPLSYPILLEIFNEGPMLAGNLGQYLGSISGADFKRIAEARNIFNDGETTEPDSDYLIWKLREIEFARYLKFPVNESIWEEGIVIPLRRPRKAADALGIELTDIKAHTLVVTKDFTIAVVQIRDEVILRFSSKTREPGEVRINQKPSKFLKSDECSYSVKLGYVENMSESIEIAVTVEDETFEFHRRFEKDTS